VHRNTEHENLKPGTLLRVKEHCRNNIAIQENGIFAIIAPKEVKASTNMLWDVVFPSGLRMIYLPMNWEVVSHAE
jgi:hypothetical protein